MNKSRRRALKKINDRTQDLIIQLEEIHTDLHSQYEAEQEAFDNLSEGLQSGERGQAIETAAQSLESASDELESAIDSLRDILGHLDEATA